VSPSRPLSLENGRGPGKIQENLETRPEGGLETSEFESIKAAGEAGNLATDADFARRISPPRIQDERPRVETA
jgi:hypothetical protein